MKFILRNLIILTILLFGLNSYLSAQKKWATFGIHVEPIVPLEMFRIRSSEVIRESVKFTSKPLSGFTLGTHLSVELTPRFSIETGINYVSRNFLLSVEDGSFTDEINFKADNFEIPLTLTYYVKLSEKLFLGHSIGTSIQLIPSNLYSRNDKKNNTGTTTYSFNQFSQRKGTIVPIFKGAVGLEYRSKESGYFYVGPVYHLFAELYQTKLNYYNISTSKQIDNVVTKTIGDYFGIEIRYVFKPTELIVNKKNKD